VQNNIQQPSTPEHIELPSTSSVHCKGEIPDKNRKNTAIDRKMQISK
jgi:hypothetical protein